MSDNIQHLSEDDIYRVISMTKNPKVIENIAQYGHIDVATSDYATGDALTTLYNNLDKNDITSHAIENIIGHSECPADLMMKIIDDGHADSHWEFILNNTDSLDIALLAFYMLDDDTRDEYDFYKLDLCPQEMIVSKLSKDFSPHLFSHPSLGMDYIVDWLDNVAPSQPPLIVKSVVDNIMEREMSESDIDRIVYSLSRKSFFNDVSMSILGSDKVSGKSLSIMYDKAKDIGIINAIFSHENCSYELSEKIIHDGVIFL